MQVSPPFKWPIEQMLTLCTTLLLPEFDGAIAKSTVRRPATQRAFIKEVGRQTQVLKLQGFLFFGTFSAVEDEIRRLLDVAVWEHNPIRFLILDLWFVLSSHSCAEILDLRLTSPPDAPRFTRMVYGLDFSSAEAFVRIQRLLAAKGVVLIFCGAHPEGAVGKALQAVELWSDEAEGNVQVFDTLNDALEWTENAYLYVLSQRLPAASATDLVAFTGLSGLPSTPHLNASRKHRRLISRSLRSDLTLRSVSRTRTRLDAGTSPKPETRRSSRTRTTPTLPRPSTTTFSPPGSSLTGRPSLRRCRCS